MLDHDIKLSKLNKCGIRGNVTDWFKIDLEDRSQAVKVKNFVSSQVLFIAYG